MDRHRHIDVWWLGVTSYLHGPAGVTSCIVSACCHARFMPYICRAIIYNAVSACILHIYRVHNVVWIWLAMTRVIALIGMKWHGVNGKTLQTVGYILSVFLISRITASLPWVLYRSRAKMTMMMTTTRATTTTVTTTTTTTTSFSSTFICFTDVHSRISGSTDARLTISKKYLATKPASERGAEEAAAVGQQQGQG